MKKVFGSFLLTASMVLFAGSAMAQECGNTDFNGDGVTDPTDVEIFQSALGSQEGDSNYISAADLDGDGAVTAADYGIMLSCN